MNKRGLLCVAIAILFVTTPFAVAGSPDNDVAKQAWWTSSEAGWIGGIGGGSMGLIGALFGIFAAIPSTRRYALPLAVGMSCFGVVLVVAGIVSLTQTQPYHVYYPLLLGGLICAIVFGAQIHTIRQLLRMAELQKMSAQDIGG